MILLIVTPNQQSHVTGLCFSINIECSHTLAQQTHIITLPDVGTSGHQIHRLTGLGIGTISRVHSQYCSDLTKTSGGRPSKLTAANIGYAKRIVRMGKADNAVQVTKALQDVTNQSISSQTVRHNLKKSGLRPVVKKKQPLLKPRHRKDRLDFAESHKEWTLGNWKRVIWSDETKIDRLGSDGRKWVWKEVGEQLNDRVVEGTVKFGGGNVMVWGWMGWDGVGYATRIEGKMDADLYVSIMEGELQESLHYYNKTFSDIIFQQDNDPKHTSKCHNNFD